MATLKHYFPVFLAGALLAFAYPNFLNTGFFALSIIAYAIYYKKILEAKSLRSAFISTLVFSLSFSQLGFYWLPQTLSTFGDINYLLAYFIALFFSLIVLPYLWLQLLCSYYLKKNKKLRPYLIPILCTTHVLFEIFTPTQFPVWLGHSILTLNTNLEMASLFGASYYTFALLCIILPLSFGLKNLKQHKVSIILGMFLLIFDLTYSVNHQHPSSTSQTSDHPINIRIVQANIGNFLKIDSESGSTNSVEQVFSLFNDLTLQASDKPLDLIIWPETAIPTVFNTDYWDVYQFSKSFYMKKIMDQLPSTTSLVFGGYDEGHLKESANNLFSEYNTAFFYHESKLETYYKIKLIPFGETLPFGNLNAQLAPYFPGVSLFSQGKKLNSFKLNDQFIFITPICYELLDTTFIRNFLNKNLATDFIINLTNDSWYGDTAEPWQHLFLTRWRALEFRKPIIRSTNTGITTFIDENGKISEFLGINEKNILDKTLYLHPNSPTLYQKWGILPLLGLMLILDLLLFYCYRRSR